ncbi:hypothetical protein D3C85_1584610 [compost metagenome]
MPTGAVDGECEAVIAWAFALFVAATGGAGEHANNIRFSHGCIGFSLGVHALKLLCLLLPQPQLRGLGELALITRRVGS